MRRQEINLQEKIKESPDHIDIRDNDDVIRLLREIRKISYKFEEDMQPHLSCFYALKRVINYKMGAEDTPNEYYEKLISLIKAYESYGGKLGDEDKLLDTDELYNALNDADKELEVNINAAKQRIKNVYIATMMIAKADHKRYSELKTELLNEYTLKSDKYPKTPIEALKILKNYRNKQGSKKSTNTSVSFAQKGKEKDNAWHKDAICHLCKKKGHIKPNCPDSKKTQ